MEWKVVVRNGKVYENYQVSDSGIVRSLDRIEVCYGMTRKRSGRILTLHSDKDGYLYCGLYSEGNGVSCRVHRIVMESFEGGSAGMEVNHINGVKTDNSLINLEYCTSKENSQHSHNVLNMQNGEDGSKAILTNTQVIEIKERLVNAVRGTQRRLAEEYGVHFSTISKIAKGVNWKCLK